MRIGKGEPKYSEKACRSVNLFTTNPTLSDLGSNPGHRGGKPAIFRRNCGTTHECIFVDIIAQKYLSLSYV
jgi:hypothetical protein